ncbi:MAG TPA: hypothetical protein VD866_26915, partial [Urbifossiella sp.]|nr:hypothetical protein [Urbifossiella sp.]
MSAAPLTPAQLRAAADALPRVSLAHLPTPLEEAPRFSAAVGGGVRVFVKRDDCTGLLLGGNKARHNEFRSVAKRNRMMSMKLGPSVSSSSG